MNITLDDIKSKAPDGATGYIKKRTRIQYWRKCKKHWWVYISGQWVVTVKSMYRDHALKSIKPL